MVKLMIYGTGRVGSRIAQQVIHEPWLETLYVWNRTHSKALGLACDLLDAFPEKDVRAPKLLSEVSSLDIIVYTASSYQPLLRKQFRSRLHEFTANKSTAEESLENLEMLYHVRSPKMFVISNPIDSMMKVLSSHIPPQHLYGVGASLDCQRLCRELKLLGVDSPQIELRGVDRQYHSIKSNVSPDVLSQAQEAVKEKTWNIVDHFGTTTEAITHSYLDIMRAYLGRQQAIDSHMSLYHQGSFETMPVRISHMLITPQ